jgi:hypothetical protein
MYIKFNKYHASKSDIKVITTHETKMIKSRITTMVNIISSFTKANHL